jgi:prepilin-type processing-associated H-X9-DG protein
LDLLRWTVKDPAFLPQQDTSGIYTTVAFGSAHASGFNMAFCDGSVQMISYSINQEVHYRLGNRQDGLSIDGNAY